MDMPVNNPSMGFWGLLSDSERVDLQKLGSVRDFQPGAALCHEGDPAGHLYVLLGGWVKILSVASDGHELILALRGHGDLVGELGLADESPGFRNATAQAVDPVRALIVEYDRFNSFLDSHPGASHAYRRAVTQRWTDSAAMLRRQSTTNGSQRLAALLLELASQHGSVNDGGSDIFMPLSQEELASLAGASRATITRALSNWRSRGIIRTGPKRLTITDPVSLRRIAEQTSYSV